MKRYKIQLTEKQFNLVADALSEWGDMLLESSSPNTRKSGRDTTKTLNSIFRQKEKQDEKVQDRTNR